MTVSTAVIGLCAVMSVSIALCVVSEWIIRRLWP
jgi:hypothetical protein